MSKQIRIEIKKDGTVKAETIGIKGKECIKYMDIIEKICNSKIVDSEFNQDYYENIETNIEEEKIYSIKLKSDK